MIDTVFEKSVNDGLAVVVYDCAGDALLHIPSGRFLSIEYTDADKCSASCEMSIEEAEGLYHALGEYFRDYPRESQGSLARDRLG